MQTYLWWWIFAAILVGIELTSGTFYLLVYGLAAAVAGLAAWLGAGLVVQLLVAGGIAALGTLALQKWKRNTGAPSPADPPLDIGQTVQVETWGADRGQVKYRGAVWDAEAESPDVDPANTLHIRAIKGNILIVGN